MSKRLLAAIAFSVIAAVGLGQSSNTADPLSNFAVRLDGGDIVETGTVTSVGISVPSQFTLSGSPITGSGTFTISQASQAAGTFFGVDFSAGAVPTFQAPAVSDGACLGRSGNNWASLACSGGGAMATDALWDAAGDLAVGTGANTGARLAIGGNNTLLKSNGSAVSWGAVDVSTAQVTGLLPLANLANGSAISVLGRSANSSGVMASITCTGGTDAVIRESGSTLGCGTVATAGIAGDAITNAKLANMTAPAIKGRTTTGAGDPEDLTVAQLAEMLHKHTTYAGWFDDLCMGTNSNGGRMDKYLAVLANSATVLPYGDSSLAVDHPCMIDGVLQTSAASSFALVATDSGQVRNMKLTGGAAVLNTSVRFEDLATDATEDYVYRWGLLYGVGALTTNVRFQYDVGAGGNFWQICHQENGGGDSCTTTTTAIAADTWYPLEIRINAAGTSANFYVNGTETSGSPLTLSATTNNVINMMEVTKNTGTATRHIYIDYLGFYQALTNAR